MPPELDYPTMSKDIILKGSLRKAKNWNKRYFVLRDSFPPQLEYYESERKWKNNINKPKRRINLEKPWNIDKKKDSKHDHLIVIFTEDDYFSMAAESSDVQEQWVNALQQTVKPEPGWLLFKHMWHVVLDNKELECSKPVVLESKDLEYCKSNAVMNLHGPHRVCLTHDQMVFVHANSNGGGDRNKGKPIEILLNSIRVCGHKEGKFFIEPGRGSGIGKGKLWMDLNDEVMASNMHTTIVNIMHALSQEEAAGYRGRSYSSGSNSGRIRSVRPHYNNPPPSQIGMGKIPNIVSNSKRLRCESLPASYVGGLNDSRLRTGSEGENTMRRPFRVCGIRCANGSTSPGMRNRSWVPPTRRLLHCSPYPSNITHSYTCSLPGSCNGSSAASSTEHLNTVVTSGGDYISSVVSNVNLQHPVSDSSSVDDYTGHSPSQASIQRSGSRGQRQFHGRNTPEFAHQASLTLPIQEDSEINRHYCVNCLAHIPSCYAHSQVSIGLAPPPPSAQPPSNPLLGVPASCNQECASVSSHVRNESLDDSLGSEIDPPSLSESPQQNSNLELNIHLTLNESQSKIDIDGCGNQDYSKKDETSSVPVVPSPTEQLIPSSASESFISFDDYTPMDMDNSKRYPHQKMIGDYQKISEAPQTSILARLVSSLPGVSTSSQSGSSPYSSDYTSMSSTSFESKSQGKIQSNMLNGYVPMRSLPARSLPQDIGCRRRSVPDTWYRFGMNQNRLSPPYGYSPEKTYEPMNRPHNYCSACMDRLTSQKTPIAEESNSPTHQFASPRDNLHLSSSGKDSSDFDKESNTLKSALSASNAASSPSLPVDNSPLVAASFSPINNAPDDDYLCMQSLQQHVRDMTSGRRDSGKSDITTTGKMSDSADLSFRETEINGYLPMSPIVSSILSVAESKQLPTNTPVQYPHQRKDRRGSSFSTNSLDRPKGFGRQKRPKSLGFRHTSSNSARRAQSMKQGKKTSNDSASSSQKNSPPSRTSSRPSLSPGGEYINIDFTKALSQMTSPHLVNVTSSKKVPCSPTLPIRDLAITDSDYTEMSFGSRCIQTNI